MPMVRFAQAVLLFAVLCSICAVNLDPRQEADSDAQLQNSATDAVVDIRMSELNFQTQQTVPGSEITEEYTLKVELVLFSDLGGQAPANQQAFVYETELGALVSKLELKKTKTEIISKDTFTAACEAARQGLIKTIYSGQIGVMRMINGYTIYWNKKDLPEPIMNIDPTELTDGITLKAQVPDPAERLVSSASLAHMINPNQCADGLNMIKMNLANTKMPGSIRFVKVDKGLSGQMTMNDGREMMKMSDSQTQERPLGEVKLNWNKKNNTIEINGGSPGRYLAIAEISDKPDNGSISSSQFYILFNFK